ncbi:hypothetical protein, partial [Nocardioides sp. Soil796]|uniref:hypothetical protein n=1 Tax=Nocardioides sp. Soil796 TaxID=1736412 RepID=UPI0019105B10
HPTNGGKVGSPHTASGGNNTGNTGDPESPSTESPSTGTTDPGTTDPGTTDPGTTDPGDDPAGTLTKTGEAIKKATDPVVATVTGLLGPIEKTLVATLAPVKCTAESLTLAHLGDSTYYKRCLASYGL